MSKVMSRIAPTDELATELYDLLMRNIEPDLLSFNLPFLDEYYKGETQEEHEERIQRYEAAYSEFDLVFQEFIGEVQEEVRTNRRQALKSKESQARAEEQVEISSLESVFS